MAVAIVVSMAVPVLAVISDGSEQSTEDMIVSIQDTDSFGGDGLQPGDGVGSSTWNGEELYVPGANLGIGYGTEGSAEQAVTASSETPKSERPRYFDYTAALARGGRGSSGGNSGGGVNLMTSGGGGGGAAAPAAIPATAASAPLPATPGAGNAAGSGSSKLALRSDHCYDVADAVKEPRYANYVVASGR